MKKTFYTIGSTIVFLIAAFIFIVLPALSSKASSTQEFPPLGKYDNKLIKYEPNSDFSMYYQYYARPYGEKLPQDAMLYIMNQAFDSTVQQYAYTSEVEKSGYEVPQNAINRELITYFSDQEGNYSPKLYKQTPTSQIESMQNRIKSSLTATRFNNDIFSLSYGEDQSLYGLKPSSKEAEFLKKFNNNKRIFNVAVFDMEQYPESEKISYAKSNQDKFIKHNMKVITVDDKSKAQTVLKRISNNEISFDDAVSEYSSKTYSSSDGTLTSEYNYELEKIIKNESDFAALKELEKEQTSQVIETETGFSIFFVTAEKIMPDFNDTSFIGDVYNYLTSYEFGHIENYYTNRANDFIATANASTFASACSSLNVEHQRLDAFPLNYGSAPIASSLDTSAKGLSGADINEHFLKTAFSLSENELSSPIVNGKSLLVLQYLYEQDASDSETSDSSNLSQEISSFDSYSVSQKIKSSPKLENNVLNVFLNHLLPSNE